MKPIKSGQKPIHKVTKRELTIIERAMATSDKLYPPSAAAIFLGISANAIRWNADQGHLPCITTVTGSRLFLESDLLEFKSKREEFKKSKEQV